MLRKLLLLVLSISVAFGLNLQTASKEELISIKGIGKVKAQAIIDYRKNHKINSPKDLLAVKGIGKSIVNNIISLESNSKKNEKKPKTSKEHKNK